MTVTVIDGEWTVDNYEYHNPYTGTVQKETDGSPYNPKNSLVSLGVLCSDKTKGYAFFNHKDIKNKWTTDGKEYRDKAFEFIQGVLDKTKVLVGHNLKSDISWILSAGFILPKDIKVFDTMIFEYVAAKAIRKSLKLKDCCDSRGVRAKLDILEKYFSEGFNTDEVPLDDLYTYGWGDIVSTAELYKIHRNMLKNDLEISSMTKILKPMNEFLLLLTEMEMNGAKVDMEELDRVEKLFIEEREQLEKDLNKIIKAVMGDTPISLGSSEQISQVVFGIEVIDKKGWKDAFNIGVVADGPRKGKPKYLKRHTKAETEKVIDKCCKRLKRTKVHKCRACNGWGKYYKKKKDGSNYAKPFNCTSCKGSKVYYEDTEVEAGLKVRHYSWDFAGDGGFSLGKKNPDGTKAIDTLLDMPLNKVARAFLTKYKRYNSISNYLTSFIGGIKKRSHSSVLHVNYNQCVTLTGRLSSTFHNLPRGNTFPVKKAIVSRWKGGKILDCDFGQLEFRVAALLSKCSRAAEFILADKDAHVFSRDTLESYGHIYKGDSPEEKRQEAKAHSFKPLYGGMSGTDAQVKYFKYFLEYFSGIDEWQKWLGEQAIKYKQTQTPSGRIYSYPYASRLASGRVSSYTQICNYPVQGFGFDIVMITMLELWRLMKEAEVNSKVILTVHDSVTCDVFPGEEKIMVDIYNKVFNNVPKIIEERFGLECNVPLTYDLEIGNNWMEKEEVRC